MDLAAAMDGLKMIITMEKAVQRPGCEVAIAKWEALLGQLADYKYDSDGALREWAVSEYTENNNHRHLSHLYVAWPAYETQDNARLKEGANTAIKNREIYNVDNATAVHGLMARTWIEIKELYWDISSKKVLVILNSSRNDNVIRLKLGVPWREARVDGNKIKAQCDNDTNV